MKGAYKNFKNARAIRSIMGQPFQRDAEFDYLRKLMNFSNSLGGQKRYTEQLAYLEIVNEFNPQHPGVASELAKTQKKTGWDGFDKYAG